MACIKKLLKLNKKRKNIGTWKECTGLNEREKKVFKALHAPVCNCHCENYEIIEYI